MLISQPILGIDKRLELSVGNRVARQIQKVGSRRVRPFPRRGSRGGLVHPTGDLHPVDVGQAVRAQAYAGAGVTQAAQCFARGQSLFRAAGVGPFLDQGDQRTRSMDLVTSS